ncbi:hypothetical protein PF005_g12032 [Phytophthora fragariae]|uniref:Uncharacterized protein n=1 Tax=Phytophthora fragariae TaxID=53985 RepID=A0A6A3S647_9STRA|nr:hypothetical protein PF003_g30360 [Phytophthora fragariae]KAE8947757.1 hypothetical protein PF009_g2655 [Phytophthora fragariae]KAE9109781.1 hypothetical protein PF007_g12113 [Phytophthora fragariae]KAE9147788.1 hypothetical protein PF006_g7563 [Phytophthora fragariae]KAE9208879.1 hypothetical protein PF005_g12032 [Phytophthora fragariae]
MVLVAIVFQKWSRVVLFVFADECTALATTTSGKVRTCHLYR